MKKMHSTDKDTMTVSYKKLFYETQVHGFNFIKYQTQTHFNLKGYNNSNFNKDMMKNRNCIWKFVVVQGGLK